MSIKITDTAITAAVKRAAETKTRVELIDPDHTGLRLRVSPSGGKSWTLAMRSDGAMRRFPLGSHPGMGLANARKAASVMYAAVKSGADPVKEARRRRAINKDASEGVGTLAALVELYGKKRGASLKSWPECKKRIDSVFAKLLQKPIATMKQGDLQFEADSWPSQQSAAAAVRYIRPILKWASDGGRGYATRELADLKPPAVVGKRDRVLSRDELSRLLPVMKSATRPYAQAMYLMLLTAVRREEAGAAVWGDFDLDAKTWKIPTTKNGKPHTVPLSRQAEALLRSIKPNDAGHNKLVFSTRSGGRLANWFKGTVTLQEASKTEGWQRHDLRRTAATLMGEAGEPPHIVEAALGHAAIHSQLASIYNAARYTAEVSLALQRLADDLDVLATKGAKQKA